MLKKGLIGLAILLVLIVALGLAAIWYVQPSEELDLRYSPVPLEDRAVDMAKNLSTSMSLSEADVNNIAKAYIADNPQYGTNVTITGARFGFEDGRIAAHYNLKVKDRIPVGIIVYYRVMWSEPNLVAEVDEAKLRSRPLPNDYFDDIVIPLGSYLPKPIRIQAVKLSGDRLVVTVKKPTLSDLAQLLRRELGL
ncbi:hypothetical protein [Paenibacillus sacheonensis]|uniref:DUF2140 family protein n=1 Tax=Paenibacillus sacheonensis TaxID=742054 RepID=A0A7X4YMJ5_9BACL|nr:hypothetical protein [Paenibacillus sacheonensis]MBM7563258.1 hypothetical protein [Paenibacillus sacheonensis]NBC68184.1 hypothetical protein [Paenibacillus sacheonensis]